MKKTVTLLALVLTWSIEAIAAQSPNAPVAPTCDRECLRGNMTMYLDALARHDVGKLPLGDKVRITEDSIEKPIDKVGIVRSITKFRGYRQDFLDEREGITGAHVVVEENGAPAFLVVRLKVADEKITEIETVATRSRSEGSIFNIDGVQNTTAAMNYAPKKSQLNSREEMIGIALLYPAGLEAESLVKVDAPFTPEAFRLENGEFMAGPNCKRNEDCKNIKTQSLANGNRGKIERRVAAVDERMGIVWLRLAWGGDRPAREGMSQKSQLVVWEAFKIYEGKIHAVEAFMKNVPVGVGSGWPQLNMP